MNTMEMIRGLIFCWPDASSQQGLEPDFAKLAGSTWGKGTMKKKKHSQLVLKE